VKQAAFFSDLEVEHQASGFWMLKRPLVFSCDGFVTIVPARFSTDFASVPRLPFIFWLFADDAYKAATLHDFLYFSPGVDRGFADHRFLRAMEVEGVPLWRRRPIYWAVRLFGGLVRRNTYDLY
jgi:hypothetical protein